MFFAFNVPTFAHISAVFFLGGGGDFLSGTAVTTHLETERTPLYKTWKAAQSAFLLFRKTND